MADTSVMFDEPLRQRVNQVVREAESATGAEIVAVVARGSGRYDRGEDVFGLWTAAFAIAVVWLLFPMPDRAVGHWGQLSAVWQIVALLAGGLVGFLIGVFVASRIDWLRRLFTPATQMREEVESRARAVFFDQRIHHTQSGAGILLYVSLFERRAAVIADQTVLDRLGQSQIDDLCNELTQRLREAPVVDALCETVQLAGERLAVVLPREHDDQNELADALVVID